MTETNIDFVKETVKVYVIALFLYIYFDFSESMIFLEYQKCSHLVPGRTQIPQGK